MCAPDHQLKAMLAVQAIPPCEYGRAIVAIANQAISGPAGEMGFDVVRAALAAALAMHAEAAVQRATADHERGTAPGDFDLDEFKEQIRAIGAAFSIAGPSILAMVDGIDVTEVTKNVHQGAVDAKEAGLAPPPQDFLDRDVPGFVQLVFMAVRDPKAKLQELQERIDRGEQVEESTIAILTKMAAAQEAGHEPAEGLIQDFDTDTKPIGETTAELSKNDILDMINDLADLPTTDDPTDQKE
jgi:hypothetical protein